MRYRYECALRWSDMDAYGHVNNARFLTLYEEARVALFFTGAREMGLTSFEDGIVIHRHEIDYLRLVDFGDAVRIEMWVDEIRPSRFGISYVMFDGDVVASRARSVCVPFNLENQHPRRLNEAERAFLSRWTDEASTTDAASSDAASSDAASSDAASTSGPGSTSGPSSTFDPASASGPAWAIDPASAIDPARLDPAGGRA